MYVPDELKSNTVASKHNFFAFELESRHQNKMKKKMEKTGLKSVLKSVPCAVFHSSIWGERDKERGRRLKLGLEDLIIQQKTAKGGYE